LIEPHAGLARDLNPSRQSIVVQAFNSHDQRWVGTEHRLAPGAQSAGEELVDEGGLSLRAELCWPQAKNGTDAENAVSIDVEELLGPAHTPTLSRYAEDVGPTGMALQHVGVRFRARGRWLSDCAPN